MTKDKITNNDLQNITQKTKDRATRTPLKYIYAYKIVYLIALLSVSLMTRYSSFCDFFICFFELYTYIEPFYDNLERFTLIRFDILCCIRYLVQSNITLRPTINLHTLVNIRYDQILRTTSTSTH